MSTDSYENKNMYSLTTSERLKSSLNAHYACQTFTEPLKQQRQSRARNISETLPNHSVRRRSPSPDRLSNDRNRNQTPSFRQRPQSQYVNNLDKNNIPPKPKLSQPINQTPISNVDGDTHPSVSTQLTTTQDQVHSSNDVNSQDRLDWHNFSSHICAHCNAQFDDGFHLTKHEFQTGHLLDTRLNNNIECLVAY